VVLCCSSSSVVVVVVVVAVLTSTGLDEISNKKLLPDLNDADEAMSDEQTEEKGADDEIRLVRQTKKRKAGKDIEQGCLSCCVFV